MKNQQKSIAFIPLIVALICLFGLVTGCQTKRFTDESGYWTTEDGSFVLDINSCLAKFTVDGASYYFGVATGPHAESIDIINDNENGEVPGGKTDYRVLSGKTHSYKMGSGKLVIDIEKDHYFDYEGKTVELTLVPYTDAPANVLKNDSKWKNQTDNSIYDFSDGTWTGSIQGKECHGNISVFPADEIMKLTVVSEDIDSAKYNSYIAGVTEKTDSEITLTILASNGIFKDSVGNSIVLSLQK